VSRPQENRWLFRYTALVAVCVLALIVLGAAVTSETQPIPGVQASSQVDLWLPQFHTGAAWIVGTLALGLGVWLQLGESRAWLRWLGWALVGLIVIDGWSGMQMTLESLPRAAGFVHAVLAQILFSMVIAICVATFGGLELAELLEDTGRPSLRSLAMATSLLVFLQVLLGAAYRHGMMGFLLHILDALVAGLAILAVCVLVTRQFSSIPSLNVPAIVLAGVTITQVTLGFATFIILLISSEGSPALLSLSVAHVTIGAMTLAATVLVAIQILRKIRPANRQEMTKR
jgi:heme A synthase